MLRSLKAAILFNILIGYTAINAQDLIRKTDLNTHTGIDLYSNTITDKNLLLKYLKVLSSDKFEGRRTGEKGNLKAQSYILNELKMLDIYTEIQPFIFKIQGKEILGTNIIATIKGTVHPDRYIAVSAHYDHVGLSNSITGDRVYNGADDNASGVAALLMMARYFSENPPGNSVLLIAFDAEEMGLQGSKYFISNNNRNILFNINMDMISRSENNEINVCGTRYSKTMEAYFQSAQRSDLPIKIRLGHDGLDDEASWVSSSDHYHFYKNKIPFIYFGVEDHEDYHQLTDEYEKVDHDFYHHVVTFITQCIIDMDSSITNVNN